MSSLQALLFYTRFSLLWILISLTSELLHLQDHLCLFSSDMAVIFSLPSDPSATLPINLFGSQVLRCWILRLMVQSSFAFPLLHLYGYVALGPGSQPNLT